MTAGPSLAHVRTGLQTLAMPTDAAFIHLRAFRAWLLRDQTAFSGLAEAAAEGFASAGGRAVGHVSALGYAEAADRITTGLQSTFTDGLCWLGQRAWSQPQRALTLEADGIAAFGIALGAHHVGACEGLGWLQQLVVRSATSPNLSEFERSLFVAAAHIISAPARQDISGMIPEIRVALAERGIGSADEAACDAAWQRIVRFTAAENVMPEAAAMLAALDGLTQRSLPARLGRLEPADVVNALEGVERSLRRWPWETAPRTPNSTVTRWNIENEYHVQDLLWAVLAPLFPDLNDEETLSPVGQKNPRTDLSITCLALVVEAKFMRASARFQDIIDEIASDASLYSADPRWKALVPFVWDDSRRSEEHAKLISGLRKLPMVVDAVVVSRPGRMTRVADAPPNGRNSGAPRARRASDPDAGGAGRSRSRSSKT
jgi:hypothetical protein